MAIGTKSSGYHAVTKGAAQVEPRKTFDASGLKPVFSAIKCRIDDGGDKSRKSTLIIRRRPRVSMSSPVLFKPLAFVPNLSSLPRLPAAAHDR